MLHFPFKHAQHIKDTEVITMRTWEISWSFPVIPYMTEVKGSAGTALPPKMPSPCLHPCAIFALMYHAFKRQPMLHNSADHDISKFVYLRLHLVVCFYPPTWPWSWGHTYRHLTCVKCYCFFNSNFEFSTYPSNSIVADPSIKALRTSFIQGCTIYLEVRSWSSGLARATKIVEIIVQSLLEDPLIGRYWKRSFVSL